jgi:hypothetical protein
VAEPLPVFEIVTACGDDELPTVTVPKEGDVGEALTAGPAAGHVGAKKIQSAMSAMSDAVRPFGPYTPPGSPRPAMSGVFKSDSSMMNGAPAAAWILFMLLAGLVPWQLLCAHPTKTPAICFR